MKQKHTNALWMGLAIVAALCIALFVYWNVREGFENVTDKAKAFVVSASLQTLTALATQNRLGSIERGTYTDSVAVATIGDYKGATVWSAGAAPSADTTVAQYELRFPGDITLSKFQTALPSGVTYVGTDFTSPFLVIDSKPSLVMDPYYRGNAANKYRGVLNILGQAPGGSTAPVTRITDSSGVVYFDSATAAAAAKYKVTFSAAVDLKKISDMLAVPAGTNRGTLPETDISGLTLIGTDFSDTRTAFDGVKSTTVVFQGPLAGLLSDKSIATMQTFGAAPQSIVDQAGNGIWAPTRMKVRFKVEFTRPVSLRVVTGTLARKMPNTVYVGLSFTDKPPTAASSAGVQAQLGSVDYSQKIQTATAPQSQFPATFLDSKPAAAAAAETAATETPKYTYPTQESNPPAGTNDYSRYVGGAPTPTTNRIRVRARWTPLSKPAMIKTLQLAAGKKSDGTYPQVVEILDVLNRKIWPIGGAGSVNYQDTGLSELFTVGYDTMVDTKANLEAYIRDYVPSVVFVNPAMPRA